MRRYTLATLTGVAVLFAAGLAALSARATPAASPAPGNSTPLTSPPAPTFSAAAAFDVSPPLRDLARQVVPVASKGLPPERGPVVHDNGYTGDAALQQATAPSAPSIPAPLLTFEGLRN